MTVAYVDTQTCFLFQGCLSILSLYAQDLLSTDIYPSDQMQAPDQSLVKPVKLNQPLHSLDDLVTSFRGGPDRRVIYTLLQRLI